MNITINSNSSLEAVVSDCLLLCVARGEEINSNIQPIDQLTGGVIKLLMEGEDLGTDIGSHCLFHQPKGLASKRLMLFNMGSNITSRNKWHKLLLKLASCCIHARVKNIAISVPSLMSYNEATDVSSQWVVRQFTEALWRCSYQFNEYKSHKQSIGQLEEVSIVGGDTQAIEEGIQIGEAIGKAVETTRNLGNHPSNICTPEYLEQQAHKIAESFEGVEVSALDEEQMRELGMGAILSVSVGSDRPARLIIMVYKGGKPDEAPYALAGKGITFDTGGISLKMPAAMDEMKFDMCGAAAVMGVMQAVATLKLPINLVVAVAAVENMPSGGATRPGDIITSLCGRTVEVINTDAEGRMVLCDALTYVQRYFKPKVIIDVATLTFACAIALGRNTYGLYSNHQPLAEELLNAGAISNERGWQMPLWEEYRELLNSPFADIANATGVKKEAGSITAACFLAEFCKDVKWAHLDIAGTAWLKGAKKGATGSSVAVLCQYLIDQV